MPEAPELRPDPRSEARSDRASDIDAALTAAPQRDARPAAGAAALGAALWLGLGAGIGWGLGLLPAGWAPEASLLRSGLGVLLTAPVAAAVGWAALAARIEAAERRVDALRRAALRPAGLASSVAPADRDALARAVSLAAREALDAERGAIARQLAALGAAQDRMDARLGAGRAAPEPLETPEAAARRRAAGRAAASDPLKAAAAPSSSVEADAGGMAEGAPSASAHLAPEPAAARAAAASAAGAAEAPAQFGPGGASTDDGAAFSPPSAQPPAPRTVLPGAPPRPVVDDGAQPPLPLTPDGEPPAPGAPDWPLLARALDFPRDASDAEGFAALDAALRDRPVAELLQAAEDALTLLAQHGLYMEDLEVRHAPAAAWRRFAEGARGPEVRAVGGVDAAEAVGRARALLKSDPVFRDTAMHLMRRYDGLLRRAAAAPGGEGAMLTLADSRTGRAFMLAAQALGAFD